MLNQLFIEMRTGIALIDFILVEIRRFNEDYAARYLKMLVRRFRNILDITNANASALAEKEIKVDIYTLSQRLSEIMEAQGNRDNILLADLLELRLRPFLEEQIQSMYAVVMPGDDYFDVNMQALKEKQPEFAQIIYEYIETSQCMKDMAKFPFEITNSGRLTMKKETEKESFYLYSNRNPMIAVYQWLQQEVVCGKKEYHILGAGLGYTVAMLKRVTEQSHVIHCYDTNLYMLLTALTQEHFAPMIEQGLLFFHYDSMLRDFVKAADDETNQMLIYPPAMRLIENKEIYEAVNKYYISSQSMRFQEMKLHGNFIQNQKQGLLNVDCLKEKIQGKRVFVVAAGPSLDKNVTELNKRKADDIIIATGTVFRKMMHLGIKPDYVIISEANERVLKQIKEFSNEQIPLIMLSTASHLLAVTYQGPKYLIYQEDYALAEKTAKCEQAAGIMRNLYMTGGSVSTTALDVVIRLTAKQVVFIGLDLAFTNNLAHASDTSGLLAADRDSLISVPAYGGGQVYADEKFIIYRDWIQKRLCMEDAKTVDVVDATEGGAYVEGMRRVPLADFFQNESENTKEG